MSLKVRDIFNKGPYVGFYPTDASPTAYAECRLSVDDHDMIHMRMAQHEDGDLIEEVGTVQELVDSVADRIEYIHDWALDTMSFKFNNMSIVFIDRVNFLLKALPEFRILPNLKITNEWQSCSHLGGTFLYYEDRFTDKFRGKVQKQLPYHNYASQTPRLKY